MATPTCQATITGLDERGTIHCTLPTGTHNHPTYGDYHQAPAAYPGGLTLWADTSTGATPDPATLTPQRQFRAAHGDPATWGPHDYEDYLDLPDAA